MSQLKLLCYFDSPTCATGFATVSRNILLSLYDTHKYDISILGINHDGSYYDQNKFPYKIYPAVNALRNEMDVYGRNSLLRMLSTQPVDILFMIQDTFIVQTFLDKVLELRSKLPKERQFIIVYYYPIDGKPKKEWIENVVCKIDFPVTYTEYAKRESYEVLGKEFPLDIIHHGVNKQDFYVVSDDKKFLFKNQNFKDHKDDFFILNVNRNQPRKDLYRSLCAFKLFHDKIPNSFYFINCQANDVGGNIRDIASNIGLELYKDYSFPGNFDANQGYPIEVINMFYNISDLVISTTIGEGYGLSILEGMATKTPLLFPNNTAITEVIGENEERGYLCKSGEDMDHTICLGMQDNNIIRPLINVEDMANKMIYIYEHQDEAKEKAEKAFEWVKSWKQIGKEWIEIFRKAEDKLKETRR